MQICIMSQQNIKFPVAHNGGMTFERNAVLRHNADNLLAGDSAKGLPHFADLRILHKQHLHTY